MKVQRIIGLLAVFIFIAAYLLFSQEKPQEGGAHIEFSATKYDFGTVGRDKILEHTFKFTNTGNDTLRIHRVKSS
ncbi:MAG TPA: DUF1573 domain-containing protein [Calditrichaeota bacterium]|nr:DUF1573 domain-containing protein [Calditrichota bacterium]